MSDTLILRMLCDVHLLQLSFGVDESYNLTVPTIGDPLHAQVEVSESSLFYVVQNPI